MSIYEKMLRTKTFVEPNAILNSPQLLQSIQMGAIDVSLYAVEEPISHSAATLKGVEVKIEFARQIKAPADLFGEKRDIGARDGIVVEKPYKDILTRKNTEETLKAAAEYRETARRQAKEVAEKLELLSRPYTNALMVTDNSNKTDWTGANHEEGMTTPKTLVVLSRNPEINYDTTLIMVTNVLEEIRAIRSADFRTNFIKQYLKSKATGSSEVGRE